MSGETVKVPVDRPLGSIHPNHHDIIYPINYGYINGMIAPDGEEQDAYILGVDEPIKSFTGKVIAVIHRPDDVGYGYLNAVKNVFTWDRDSGHGVLSSEYGCNDPLRKFQRVLVDCNAGS